MSPVSQPFVTFLSHVHIGCFKASMHVLYPESLLFSLTKDIKIKLILYYQTLYTTEVANNTELTQFFFLCFNFSFLCHPRKYSTKQQSKLTQTVTWSIKGYTVSTKQTDAYFPASCCKALGNQGQRSLGFDQLGQRGTMGALQAFKLFFKFNLLQSCIDILLSPQRIVTPPPPPPPPPKATSAFLDKMKTVLTPTIFLKIPLPVHQL